MIAVSVFVLLLAISIVYLYSRDRQDKVEDKSTFSFYCEEGMVIAKFSTSSVHLSLKNGNKEIDLPQDVSGSGARFSDGNMEFWNKGDNAFINEGDKSLYTNCVTGSLKLNKDINTWTDAGETFSFDYPNTFNLYGSDGSYDIDWSSGSQLAGQLLVKVVLPKTFLPNTNFSDSYFTVGVSSDPEALKDCATTTKSSDAGAGNLYETTSQKFIKDNICYAIEYTIHSTNIGNYSPDQNIKEFDKNKVENIFQKIVQSFRFLK